MGEEGSTGWVWGGGDGEDKGFIPAAGSGPAGRCRDAWKEKGAFGVHTRAGFIPGSGDSSACGEVFGGEGLSPLRCGPVSKQRQRCGGKLLSITLGAPGASGPGQ